MAPSTENFPLVASKPKVEATVSTGVTTNRVCAPLRVVLTVPANASRSIDEPLRVTPLRSMVPLTPSSVLVMPRALRPLLSEIALKLTAPVALTVKPVSTLIAEPSISSEPRIPSRLPLISTFDLPALMMSEAMAERRVANTPEAPPIFSENWTPPAPLSLTSRVSRPVGSWRLMTDPAAESV